jgi:hypothetical protein
MIDDFDIEIIPLNQQQKTKTIKIDASKAISLKKKRKSKEESGNTKRNKEDKKKNNTIKKENNTIKKKKNTIKKEKIKDENYKKNNESTDKVKFKTGKKRKTEKKQKIDKIPIIKVNKVDTSKINKKTPEFLLNNSITLSRKKSPKKISPVKKNNFIEHKKSYQKQPEYNYRLLEAQRRKKEIEYKLKILQRNQSIKKNPIEDYFKNKKKSPPRKQITINPNYNINISQTSNQSNKKQILKTKTKHDLLKKKEQLLRLKEKKTLKNQSIINNNNLYFKHKYKSPCINTLEYKQKKLKQQRLQELKKIQLKKKKIIELQNKEFEIKIMNDIEKEKELIKKLQDDQYKLDKLQYMYIKNQKIKYFNENRKDMKNTNTNTNTNNNTNTLVEFNIKKNEKKTIKYSVDGIPLNNIEIKINKDKENINIINNNTNTENIDMDEYYTYNIDDFSNIEDFSTDYNEEIWEYNMNNENYNNLLFKNENNYKLNYNIIYEDDLNDDDLNDDTLVDIIKSKLITNCYIKKEDSLSNNMLKILYKNLIKQKKILLL